jgi:hypothetical protein
MSQWWMMLSAALIIAGCAPHRQAAPVDQLHVLYQRGESKTGPKFRSDPRRVIRIDAGKRTSSMVGMTTKGLCQVVERYDRGRVHFGDGTSQDVSPMTVEGWSGYQPSLVR